MCKWKLWRKLDWYIYHHKKFADLKASSVLSSTETILCVVLFSGFGDGLFLVYRLSLKVAVSWLASKSQLPQRRNPSSHVLVEQSSAKPVWEGRLELDDFVLL